MDNELVKEYKKGDKDFEKIRKIMAELLNLGEDKNIPIKLFHSAILNLAASVIANNNVERRNKDFLNAFLESIEPYEKAWSDFLEKNKEGS